MATYVWNVRAGLPASYVLPADWTVSYGLPASLTLTTISAGGVAVTTQDITLGMSVGQSGTLLLAGAATSLAAGGMGVGVFGVGRLSISSGATLTTSGAGGVDSIGYEAGGTGTVSIDGSGSCWISQAAFLNVGYEGQAVLDVTNGGALVMQGYLAVAAAAGQTGLATLVGPNSSLSAAAGVMVEGGGGRLRIFTGARLETGGVQDQVGDLSGAGRASVSGSGATWIENAGSLVVASPGVESSLMMSDGGSVLVGQALQVGDAAMAGFVDVREAGTLAVTASGQNLRYLVAVGVQTGSAGTISVAGGGATLDNGGNPMLLGDLGSGTLAIGSGGSVTAGVSDDTQIDAASALVLGADPGGSGVLTIQGVGATLTVNGGGFAGSGGGAQITVQGGGVLVAGDTGATAGGFGLSIGAGAAPPGTTRITSGGTATLGIASFGTVIERNSFSVGLHGSTGSVTIGSQGLLEFAGQMAISNGDSIVGAGAGSVTIGGGGTLAALGPTVAAPLAAGHLPALSIGQGQYGNAGAAGTLVVSGFGATVNTGSYGIAVGGVAGADVIGGGGTGTLTVAAGASVLCGAPSAGDAALASGVAGNSVGTVTVTGIASTLRAAGQIEIGIAGLGTLAVLGGAAVTATQMQIGLDPGGSGTVNIGTGGTLAVSGAVSVGLAGGATLAVAAGASLSAGGGVTIGAGGTLQMQGAFAAGGSIGFSGAGGVLDINDPADFHGIVAGFEAGDTLAIAGLTALTATITVAGGNTLLSLSTGGTIDFAGSYGGNGAQLAALLGLPTPQTNALLSTAEPAAETSSTIALGAAQLTGNTAWEFLADSMAEDFRAAGAAASMQDLSSADASLLDMRQIEDLLAVVPLMSPADTDGTGWVQPMAGAPVTAMLTGISAELGTFMQHAQPPAHGMSL